VRADRLLSILMLLQARGSMTAQALADELEVSVRTIYRDLEALSMASVPITTTRGRGGGCALAHGYRSSLTGLTDDELQALFLLRIPAALADLGLGPELQAAFRKLNAALPPERRQRQDRVRQRIHLDWSGPTPEEDAGGHLQMVQRAVMEDRRLRLTYRQDHDAYRRDFQQVVAAHGLVAWDGTWHLVGAAGGPIRVYPIPSLLDVQLLDERFVRPADFDLEVFWRDWCAGAGACRPRYVVRVRVSPELASRPPLHLSEAVRRKIAAAATPDADGWLTVELVFDSMATARAHLLGCGGAVEVLSPWPLRLTLADFGEQAARRNGS
jgi:predicted DNA-binding transcriptional regulator YafY